jgi:hypothetical protein
VEDAIATALAAARREGEAAGLEKAAADTRQSGYTLQHAGQQALANSLFHVAAGLEGEAETTRLKEAIHRLTLEIGDDMLEKMRGVWGNTNVAVLRHWRDEAARLLKPARPAQGEE